MSRKQGPPKGGRGAPAGAGDLTPEAAKGGRQPHASEFGSHPHLGDGAPAPPHRPPQPQDGDATDREWRQSPTLLWRESEQWFGGDAA